MKGPYSAYGLAVMKDGQVYTFGNNEGHTKTMADTLNKQAFDERVREHSGDLIAVVKAYRVQHQTRCDCSACKASDELIGKIEYQGGS